MKKYLWLAVVVFAFCGTALGVTETVLGPAQVVERFFPPDFELCLTNYENGYCFVKQVEGDAARIGISLRHSRPRCKYVHEDKELEVWLDVYPNGYLTGVYYSYDLSLNDDEKKMYIKQCFDSLEPTAINVLVVAYGV